MQPENPVILYDGECGLCSRVVQFVLRYDRAGQFLFCSLQSETARKLLKDKGDPGPDSDTIVVLSKGQVYVRSRAAIYIAAGLRFPWSLGGALIVIPEPLRDLCYRFISRHRRKIVQKSASCAIPDASMRSRFLG